MRLFHRHPTRARRAATVAAATVVLTAAGAISPAIADGFVDAGVAHDAVGDAVGTKSPPAADLAAFDVRTLTARQILTDDGRLRHAAVAQLADGTRLREVSGLRFRVDLTTSAGAAATVVGAAGSPATFTVNGAPIVCRDLTFTQHPKVGQLRVSWPSACTPAGGTVSLSGKVTAYLGGGRQVTDRVGATPAAALDGAVFNAATVTDPDDDVTYLVDPDTTRYAARAGDLRQVTATTVPGGVRVRVRVLDLSTSAWDPAQRFTITLRNGSTVLATFTTQADPARAGHPIPVGCASALYPRHGTTFTLTVPTSCLNGAATARVGVRSETRDASGTLLGHDTAPTTRLVRVS